MRGRNLLKALWESYRRMVLVAVVLLILNVVLFVLVNSLLVPHVNRAELEFTRLQEAVRAGQLPGVNLSQEALYQLSGQDLERVFERIPTLEALPDLVGELSRISRTAGLEINRVQYQPREEPQLDLVRYTLEFDLAGDYRQLKRFVYELEQSERLVILDSLSLARTAADSGGVSLRLKFTTYFRQGAA